MANFRVIFNDSLAHKADYQGGFITKNGRKNNSPEYNHDYYEKNKDKWPEYPSQQPDKGKITAPSENKGGKMSNGMPSNIKKPTTDVHELLKMVAERHAQIKTSAIAEEEPSSGSGGKGRKGSGGGKGKSASAKEATEKAPKAEKAAKKSSGGSSSKDNEKKKSEEEEKKKAEEEKKKKEEEEKKKDPIDSDESLSDKEKQMYKGIANMAEKSGQSIGDYVENEGFDSLFNKYFPGEIDPKEKEQVKKKFMEYYKLGETIKHGMDICEDIGIMENYKLRGSSLSHGSNYKGGFVMVNGRKNNSQDYNHDYYEKNKNKWRTKYNKVKDWLGYDEREERDIASDLYDEQREKFEKDREFYADWFNEANKKGGSEFDSYNRAWEYDRGYYETARNAYYEAEEKYGKTPIGKLENAGKFVTGTIEAGSRIVSNAAKTSFNAVAKTFSDIVTAIKKR